MKTLTLLLFVVCLTLPIFSQWSSDWTLVRQTYTVSQLTCSEDGQLVSYVQPWDISSSNDIGTNWSHYDLPHHGRRVYFQNALTGWAYTVYGGPMGNPSWLGKTTDGGATWNTLYESSYPIIVAGDFLEAGALYLTGPGGIKKSTDNGASWVYDLEAYNVPVICKDGNDLYACKVTEEDTSYVMKKTESGWLQLFRLPGTTPYHQYCVFKSLYVNAGIIFVLHDASVSKYENGILNTVAVDKKLYGITFLNDNTGYAVGGDSIAALYETTNKGQSWVKKDEISGGYFGSVVVSRGKIFVNFQEANTLTSKILRRDPLTGFENNQLPASFSVAQNFPNPFNPTTTINYTIPKYSKVSLRVYDIAGKEVANLVDKDEVVGAYSVVFNASHLSSGIYFYTLTNGNQKITKKMMLIK